MIIAEWGVRRTDPSNAQSRANFVLRPKRHKTKTQLCGDVDSNVVSMLDSKFNSQRTINVVFTKLFQR